MRRAGGEAAPASPVSVGLIPVLQVGTGGTEEGAEAARGELGMSPGCPRILTPPPKAAFHPRVAPERDWRGSMGFSWCLERDFLALPSWPAGLQPRIGVDGNNSMIFIPRMEITP